MKKDGTVKSRPLLEYSAGDFVSVRNNLCQVILVTDTLRFDTGEFHYTMQSIGFTINISQYRSLKRHRVLTDDN